MRLTAGERSHDGMREPLHVAAVRSRLSRMGYRLHQHAFTSDDFEGICEAEEIILVRYPHPWTGAYFRHRGFDVIYIRSTLSGLLKPFVELHELAHFWLHYPEGPPPAQRAQLFDARRMLIDKVEHQASVIASLMLIPTIHIETYSTYELLELYGDRHIVEFRLCIYRTIGN